MLQFFNTLILGHFIAELCHLSYKPLLLMNPQHGIKKLFLYKTKMVSYSKMLLYLLLPALLRGEPCSRVSISGGSGMVAIYGVIYRKNTKLTRIYLLLIKNHFFIDFLKNFHTLSRVSINLYSKDLRTIKRKGSIPTT